MEQKKTLKICKGRYRNGERCDELARIGGYCVTHYKIYILDQTGDRNEQKRTDDTTEQSKAKD